MRAIRVVAPCVVVGLLLSLNGCGSQLTDIKCASADQAYASKPDLAQVEALYPLARTDLQLLTPKNIANYSQEQIDQIYARLTAGPIPDGAFDGDLFFPKNASGDRRIAEII